MPYFNRDPKRDHNFDNHPYGLFSKSWAFLVIYYIRAPNIWVPTWNLTFGNYPYKSYLAQNVAGYGQYTRLNCCPVSSPLQHWYQTSSGLIHVNDAFALGFLWLWVAGISREVNPWTQQHARNRQFRNLQNRSCAAPVF